MTRRSALSLCAPRASAHMDGYPRPVSVFRGQPRPALGVGKEELSWVQDVIASCGALCESYAKTAQGLADAGEFAGAAVDFAHAEYWSMRAFYFARGIA